MLKTGFDHYRDGQYFDAHECWEELWDDRGLQHRAPVHGLIQVAVSLVHVENGNLTGARNLARKALDKLHQFGSVPWLHPQALSAVERYRAHLEELDSLADFDRDFIPQLEP